MSEVYVGSYQERASYDPDYAATLPKMADHLSDVPVPHEKEIAAYLRGGGTCRGMTSAWETDVFTGERTDVHKNLRTDGEYMWGEPLAYYVERYHLVLPEDFVRHVLDVQGRKAAD